MKEGRPAPRQSELQRATLEGNIRMPQVGLAIALQGAERCLASEDPRAAMDELLAPIPLDDESLLDRIKKANAQHAHHGIGITLKPDDVRWVETFGNYAVLSVIGQAVGAPLRERDGFTYDVSGEWADPELRTEVDAVQDKLTPETVGFLKELFESAQEILRSPAINQLIKDRKARYYGWKDKGELAQAEAVMEARRDAYWVGMKTIEQLGATYREKQLTPEQTQMVERVMQEIRRHVPLPAGKVRGSIV